MQNRFNKTIKEKKMNEDGILACVRFTISAA